MYAMKNVLDRKLSARVRERDDRQRKSVLELKREREKNRNRQPRREMQPESCKMAMRNTREEQRAKLEEKEKIKVGQIGKEIE